MTITRINVLQAVILLLLASWLGAPIAQAAQASTQKPIDRTVAKLIRSQEKGKSFKSSFRTVVALGPSAVPTLMDLAKDPNLPNYQRWTSTRAAGRIGHESAYPRLMEMLKDSDPVMRMAALHALGDMGSQAAIPEMIKVAQNDGAMVVRMTAVRVLGLLQAAEALPVLEKTFWDERNFIKGKSLFIRRHAIAAMGQIHQREATPTLIKALDDPDLTIHPVAVHSLEEITGLTFQAKNQGTVNQHWKDWWEKELKRIPQLPDQVAPEGTTDVPPASAPAVENGELSQL